MIFTPLDGDDVFCALLDQVAHLVIEMTDVFHRDFIARTFGSIH